MKTDLFQDGWYYGPDGAARQAADMAARKQKVRDWIEAGPGRLTADEMMVLAWYREAKARVEPDRYADDDTGTTGFGMAVDVLMVGNPGTVGVVNHQLDHIGGGLNSIIHGEDVAHGVNVNPGHGPLCAETPRQLIPFAVIANRLGAYEIAHEGMVWPHRGLAALEKKGTQ